MEAEYSEDDMKQLDELIKDYESTINHAIETRIKLLDVIHNTKPVDDFDAYMEGIFLMDDKFRDTVKKQNSE